MTNFTQKTARDELFEAKQTNIKLRLKTNFLSSQLKSLHQLLSSAQRELADLKASASTANSSSIENAISHYKTIIDRLKSLKTENEWLKKQLSQAKKQKSDLMANFGALQSKFGAATEKMAEESTRKNEALIRSKKELEERLCELKEKKAVLAGGFETSFESSLKDGKPQIHPEKDTNSNINEKLYHLTNQIDSLQRDKKALNEKVVQLSVDLQHYHSMKAKLAAYSPAERPLDDILERFAKSEQFSKETFSELQRIKTGGKRLEACESKKESSMQIEIDTLKIANQHFAEKLAEKEALNLRLRERVENKKRLMRSFELENKAKGLERIYENRLLHKKQKIAEQKKQIRKLITLQTKYAAIESKVQKLGGENLRRAADGFDPTEELGSIRGDLEQTRGLFLSSAENGSESSLEDTSESAEEEIGRVWEGAEAAPGGNAGAEDVICLD